MLKFIVSKKTLQNGWLLTKANDKPKLIRKALGIKPHACYFFSYGNDRGYIAFYDHASGGIKVLVSIAGTDDIKDWIENCDCELDGMGRHQGFYEPAEVIWNDIIVPHVSAWRNVKAIDFRGHSRGGAIVIGLSEFASDMSKDYPWGSNVMGITYGAPCYGDERWKVRTEGINFLRVENKFDPVPKVPFEQWGYKKEFPVLEIKQPWPWVMLPIRSHVWYGITIKSHLTQKAVATFNRG